MVDSNIKHINTDCSPSHLYGNLSSTEKQLIYIHNSEILPRIIVVDNRLVTDSNVDDKDLQNYIAKLNSSETNEMFTAKFVNCNGSYYVAVGLYGGFKLWSMDGNRLLFQIPCKVRLTRKPYAFTAIGQFKSNPKGTKYDSILGGDNYGQLFLIQGSSSNWNCKLIHSNDGITITQVESHLSTDIIACAYETGEIFLFKFKKENHAEIVVKLANELCLPCMAMTFITTGSNFLVAGFINGEIRIYNISNDCYNMVISLSGHLRQINHLVSYKNFFASCGDDCFVNLWKLQEDNTIANIGNYELPDKMPVGIKFSINEEEKIEEIIACCYDCTLLSRIKITNI